MDYGARYEAAHRRWVDLLGEIDDAQPVPSTAPWRTRELLAHVVGLAADLVTRNLDGWALDEWTAAQVEGRAGRSRAEVLAEWSALTPQLCDAFDDPAGSGLDPLFTRMAINDLLVHEHDLLEAVGVRRTIDPLDWAIVGAYRREMLDGLIAGAGLPALRVRTDEGDDWSVGGTEPSGGVTASRQELWRSLTGRRPRSVVRSFAWTVDPEPYLPGAWTSPTLPWPDDQDPLHLRTFDSGT